MCTRRRVCYIHSRIPHFWKQFYRTNAKFLRCAWYTGKTNFRIIRACIVYKLISSSTRTVCFLWKKYNIFVEKNTYAYYIYHCSVRDRNNANNNNNITCCAIVLYVSFVFTYLNAYICACVLVGYWMIVEIVLPAVFYEKKMENTHTHTHVSYARVHFRNAINPILRVSSCVGVCVIYKSSVSGKWLSV